MKYRMLKKISSLTILSASLFFGTITGFNLINIHDFNKSYVKNIENKTNWIKSISKDNLNKDFDNYSYSQAAYKKDMQFFNELLKKDIKNKDQPNSRFESMDEDFIQFLVVYNKYKNNIDIVLQQKNLINEFNDKKINNKEFSKLYGINSKKIDSFSFYDYYRVFKNNPDIENDLNSFNELLLLNNLPALILNYEETEKYDQEYSAAEKKNNEEEEKRILLKKNISYHNFINDYLNGKLTESQKYNFFKMVSFINYKINQRYQVEHIIYDKYFKDKNIYFINLLDSIYNNTKYYDKINEKISSKKELQESQSESLNH